MSNQYSRKFWNGLIAGAAQTTLLYPLDILHVRLFLQRPIDWRFYSGFNFTMFGNCLKRSVIFPLQDSITTSLATRGLACYNDSACAIGGALVGLALTPINSIRTPLQVQSILKQPHVPLGQSTNTSICTSTGTSASVRRVCGEIYQRYGYRGFYRGGLGIMLRNAVWTYVYFPCFEMCQRVSKEKFGESQTIFSSLIASIFATSIAYPLDGSRLYRQHLHPEGHNHDFLFGVRRAFSWNRNNFQSFLVGNARVSLSICLAHYIYLHLK